MEHSIKSKLHEDRELFLDLLKMTSDSLSIPIHIVEKDYYISLVLKSLSKSSHCTRIVFKGGTSLSKAFQLIDRFSEDVDFAVISTGMTGNKVKNLLSDLIKEVTTDLTEDLNFPDITKGSKYRKQAFNYASCLNFGMQMNPIPARVIVEISAFANPFPHEKCSIEPLVTTFLKQKDMKEFVEQYDVDSFQLNVLSLQQTLCEKLVALIRFSMAEDSLGSLSSKIRHFYDIEALLHKTSLVQYTQSDAFIKDMELLIHHDQQAFNEPRLWGSLSDIADAPIIHSFLAMWDRKLALEYERNLSAIAYGDIPSQEQIAATFASLLQQLQKIRISPTT